MIKPILADAEERALIEENVKCWLDDLKDVVYDIEDVLYDWTMEVDRNGSGKPKHDDIDQNETTASSDQKENKVCFFSCIPTPGSCFKLIKKFQNPRHIARRIEAINLRLDAINKLKIDYKFESRREIDQSLIDTSSLDHIIRRVPLAGGSKIQVISLLSMGGNGKTIAKIVYNDADVKSHFDKLMWVCVSDPFSKINVSKAILNFLCDNSRSEQLQQILVEIDKYIKGKRFLLVLDDVWTENYGDWNDIISSCLPGSRVLVTTRNNEVARAMKTSVPIHVNELPEEECLWLFKHFAFSGREESERDNLESIAQEMAKRCKGLALAAETLGRAMASKSTKQQWEGVLKNNLWKFEDKKKGLLPALSLSYIDLPSPIKRCFACCSVFQKDQEMSRTI
ncbi:hypothetical protein Dimus_024073 [Dionaea muscipula]